MLILIGESGSGKSAIQKKLVEKYGYKTVILSTTRPKRDNEEDGVDYHFLSEKDFIETDNEGYYISSSKYNNWWYGIPKPIDDPDKYVIVAAPKDMRHIKAASAIENICVAYINVPRRDRMIKSLLRGDDIDEAYRRSVSDEGQFDGVKDECDFLYINELNDKGEYVLNVDFLAQKIDSMYKKTV